MCVCVCVCVKERVRETEHKKSDNALNPNRLKLDDLCMMLRYMPLLIHFIYRQCLRLIDIQLRYVELKYFETVYVQHIVAKLFFRLIRNYMLVQP